MVASSLGVEEREGVGEETLALRGALGTFGGLGRWYVRVVRRRALRSGRLGRSLRRLTRSSGLRLRFSKFFTQRYASTLLRRIDVFVRRVLVPVDATVVEIVIDVYAELSRVVADRARLDASRQFQSRLLQFHLRRIQTIPQTHHLRLFRVHHRDEPSRQILFHLIHRL